MINKHRKLTRFEETVVEKENTDENKENDNIYKMYSILLEAEDQKKKYFIKTS